MGSKTGITLAVMSALLAGTYAEQNITSDTYFYGQSESVYPSRMSANNSIVFMLSTLT
jgi:hypothetical protein